MDPSTKLRAGLVSAAFAIVLLCLAVTVWQQVDDEFAKGIITLVLGRMLGYVDAIYNYEFGTTRSSAKKDETINELTKTAATVATTAQAAADTAASTPTSTDTKVGEVAIEADSVVVNSTAKGKTS